jgi:hypothetical protein
MSEMLVPSWSQAHEKEESWAWADNPTQQETNC